MFFSILKKDLKRKKTMNIILLLFVIMCSMFAAASVNNIIAVTGGIEHYFNISNVPDVMVSIPYNSDTDKLISDMPSVKSVKTENYISVFSPKSFRHNGRKMDNFINPAAFISDAEMGIHYYDEDNNIIRSVEKGSFYCTKPFLYDIDMKVGDEVVLDFENKKLALKYKGRCKGALFSSERSASPYLIINSEDHDYLKEGHVYNTLVDVKLLYVETDDIEAVRETVKANEEAYVFNTREDMKQIYLYDMILAYLMMVISIVLMVTAFVVLRFTIGFTISEEFREIGVMKAVGINNGSIRRLYIVKYLVIAAVGSAIGFFGSIPLSSMMMKTVSENMVLSSGNSTVMSIVSSAAVVLIILFFCYGCTRRVNRLSPIDAVRNGQTGERFGKKSILSLGKSKLPSTFFLSLNDILSAPKRFGIITLIFALCFLLIAVISNFTLTLQSDNMAWLFRVDGKDAVIGDNGIYSDVFADGCEAKETAYRCIDDTEKLLADNDIPCECAMTLFSQCLTEYGGKKETIGYIMSFGDKDHKLICDEGYPPEKDDEIAVTGKVMSKLGVGIGDRIKADFGGEMQEFIITGKFSSFWGGGVVAALNNDCLPGHPVIMGSMGIQIKLDNESDREDIDRTVGRIRDIEETEKVYTVSELIKTATEMSDTLEAMKKMMMILTVIVTAMIVVLMERSFISREKSEIALMKAVGVQSGSMIAQHTLRFVIVAVAACALALIFMMPVSNTLMNFVCSMIGDVEGVKCAVDPLEVFVICPVLIIGVTVIGALLTATYTRTVKASDTASIE